jgi:hemolysin activation/secretion protein
MKNLSCSPSKQASCQSQRILLAVVFVSGALQAQVLPPPPSVGRSGAQVSIVSRLFVKGFRFEGNHAFSDQELSEVIRPFTQRELGSDGLEEARRAVTLHYVHRGYVNSGAILPDQDPTDGIVLLRVVEGELVDVQLRGNKWLRDGYITSRLERWSAPPLNMNELQEGLQLLRQNPNVRQVNAELKPGTGPGKGQLDLHVEDQQPFRLGLQIDNQRPPSIGAEQFSLLAADLNLTGNSDPLQLRYGIANAGAEGLEWSGVDNLEGSYELPFTRYDTSLGLHGSRLNSTIVEETLLPLDIESLTESYGIFLRQPLFQNTKQSLSFSVGLDHRVNHTWLLGESFNITPGAVEGETTVSVLRLSQDWLLRGPNHVLALRSTFNLGLDTWGATDADAWGGPDAQFFSWLGQGQYIQRLFNTRNELVLRLTGQYTPEPLLALEQISVGGYHSVRGYIENQLVRDQGLISSLELRVPVLFDKTGAGMLHLAPFFDFGGGWNVQDSPSPTTISSTGVGLLFKAGKHFSAEFYWGYRLRDVTMPDDAGLQGHGIGFKVNAAAF